MLFLAIDAKGANLGALGSRLCAGTGNSKPPLVSPKPKPNELADEVLVCQQQMGYALADGRGFRFKVPPFLVESAAAANG